MLSGRHLQHNDARHRNEAISHDCWIYLNASANCERETNELNEKNEKKCLKKKQRKRARERRQMILFFFIRWRRSYVGESSTVRNERKQRKVSLFSSFPYRKLADNAGSDYFNLMPGRFAICLSLTEWERYTNRRRMLISSSTIPITIVTSSIRRTFRWELLRAAHERATNGMARNVCT